MYTVSRLPFTKSLAVASLAAFLCGAGLPGPAVAASRATMMNSVDAALAYSPELKARQESRQVSKHAVRRAKAGHLPTVNAYGGAGYSRLSDSTTRSYDENRSFRRVADAGMRITQPLFHGFGPTYDVEAREADLDAADKNLEDRGTSIVFDAIVTHAEVARRRALVTLAEHNVKEHARILATVGQRYRTGVATKGELNQIVARHARAKATLHTYESSLASAIAGYQRVVGQTPGELAAAPTPKREFPGIAEVRELAIEHNPGLRGSLAELRAAQGERGQAKSRFFPQLDAAAGPSWTNRDSDASREVSEFVAEVRLNWELYSGGADDATMKMASARIRQARHNLNSLMNSLSEDIESTFARYTAAAKEAEEYLASRTASRLARDDYYAQFLSAQRSLLDVLDAENDYFYAASQEVLSRTDRVIASYRLLALAGVLLPDLKIDPATLRVETATTSDNTPDMRWDFNSPLSRGTVKGMDYDVPAGSAKRDGR